MIISFGWTTQEFLEGKKTVTRRLSSERTIASWQNAWDRQRLIHKAYNKQAPYGGHQIGLIELTCRPYLEPIAEMPESDCEAEGGKCPTVAEFIDHYFKGDRTLVPLVIRFKKLESGEPVDETKPTVDTKQTHEKIIITDHFAVDGCVFDVVKLEDGWATTLGGSRFHDGQYRVADAVDWLELDPKLVNPDLLKAPGELLKGSF